MRMSSYLVPSKAESIIYGFDAVEIGVRKAYLIKNGKRVTSKFYNSADEPHKKRFSEWVEFLSE